MNIPEILTNKEGKPRFSFEVLPPLKGNGPDALYRTIDSLIDYDPLFINITNHQSEYVYTELPDGLLERHSVRRRPGSIAMAAAIQNRYKVPVVPHLICSGASRFDIEYDLIDLQFLGIKNLLLLRGDKAKEERRFTPAKDGYAHTTELMAQVKQFNEGFFVDGTPIKHPGPKFNYGVACYPEKHEEAPNMTEDLKHLKEKQDLGAEYAVTQLFYDNRSFFAFVERARQEGITIPIIPAIKPFAKLSQLTVVPKTFHCDMPEELVGEALKCKTDDDAKALGKEWALHQVSELIEHGFRDVHFFTVSAADVVREVVSRLY